MTNPFARFVHTSAIASVPHDPSISLASNCVRDFFGPTVQLVADCLQARGGSSTLSQICDTIVSKSRPKVRSDERKEIMLGLRPASSASGDGPSAASIRASLLVMVQHSIVTVTKKTVTRKRQSAKKSTKRTTYSYEFRGDRARLLPRYPRFVAYARKAVDENAAALVEELLHRGRMKTVDLIVATVEQLHQIGDAGQRSDKYTTRQAVLENFQRMVSLGFIERVSEIEDLTEPKIDYGHENEFGGDDVGGDAGMPPPSKKPRLMVKSEEDVVDDDEYLGEHHRPDDLAVLSLLQVTACRILPRDAVWRVNLQMFHDSIRAVALGRLVSERYRHKVEFSGPIITAALKLAAHKQHAERIQDYESRALFTTESILPHLQKAAQQSLEKKPGGLIPNLYKALMQLTNLRNPCVLEVMEVAGGQVEKAKFRVATSRLAHYLQDRIIHQVILDSHGEVAARICSILRVNGYLEAEAIAEKAMVPAKDTREVLHRLYRANYIDLFNINQGKQHNPGNMLYLWSLDKKRIRRIVTDTVSTCLLNMRLRRQHEVEVGKDYIERAKEAGANDENDNETDKVNYNRFCQGLERLDVAALQLDETMMVLTAF